MKVVGLVSGGKDSCYNMMLCVAAGHTITALAHIKPHSGAEQDSMMYQSVGHEGVSLYAEAMGLPLYIGTTLGKTSQTSLEYQMVEGDEVEDLTELLQRVKNDTNIEGVSVGAVLSDYQRIRVENVCQRLGLTSLAYMWRQDQLSLIHDMLSDGVEAVIVKIASIGLEVKHLGTSIRDMQPTLMKLRERFGVSVCGEGGEYETFTLDCPLFKKRIEIEESSVIIHSDDAYAPVAYLKLNKLVLRDKQDPVKPHPLPQPHPPHTDQNQVDHEYTQVHVVNQDAKLGKWVWLAVDGDPAHSLITDQCRHLLQLVSTKLSTHGTDWVGVALVYLLLGDMSQYRLVNDIYSPLITARPPARVCVTTKLPRGVQLRLELLVSLKEAESVSHMHVQSLSHWAPPNIGPYSQAYTVGRIVLLAGVIGLVPHSNSLADTHSQPGLSLHHSAAILTANHTHWSNCLCGVCYCVTMDTVIEAKRIWKECMGSIVGSPIAFTLVSKLPRGADIEWHFIATRIPAVLHYQSECYVNDHYLVHTHTATETTPTSEWEGSDEVGGAEESDTPVSCCMISVYLLPCSIITDPDKLLADAIPLSLRYLSQATPTSLCPHTNSMKLLKVFIPLRNTNIDQSAMNANITAALGSDIAVSLIPNNAQLSQYIPLTIQLICL